MNAGELTEAGAPETLVPARSCRKVPEGRSCSEVLEAAAICQYMWQFFNYWFPAELHQTESSFFSKLGPGALPAIWSHLEFVREEQSYWTVLLELGLALDHFIWHLSGWLQCFPVECRVQFSIQYMCDFTANVTHHGIPMFGTKK